MLIFEIRTDMAASILVNLILVPGKKNSTEICRHLEANKVKSQ